MKIGLIQIKNNNRFEIDFELMQKAGFNSIDLQNFIPIDSKLYSMDSVKRNSF